MELNFARPPAWGADAACAGQVNDDMWFPASTSRVSKEVRDMCRGCDARIACLSWAIENNEHGIWAGTTEEHRKRLTWAPSGPCALEGCDQLAPNSRRYCCQDHSEQGRVATAKANADKRGAA